MNLEQEITTDLGFFARAGVANGSKESYEFTDIGSTVAAGLALSSASWNRPNDTFGFAAWSTASRKRAGAISMRRSRHSRRRRAPAERRSGKKHRNLLQLPAVVMARDLGLSARRQPGLQSRPRIGVDFRRPCTVTRAGASTERPPREGGLSHRVALTRATAGRRCWGRTSPPGAPRSLLNSGDGRARA